MTMSEKRTASCGKAQTLRYGGCVLQLQTWWVKLQADIAEASLDMTSQALPCLLSPDDASLRSDFLSIQTPSLVKCSCSRCWWSCNCCLRSESLSNRPHFSWKNKPIKRNNPCSNELRNQNLTVQVKAKQCIKNFNSHKIVMVCWVTPNIQKERRILIITKKKKLWERL